MRAERTFEPWEAIGSNVAAYRFHFETRPRLDPMLVAVDPERPWLAVATWPLGVDAPASASPLCCYLDTVILYEQPYRVVDGNFAEHGRCQTQLRLDDVLHYEGRQWIVQSGRVSHDGDVWIMTWKLRRLPLDREIAVQ